MICESKVMVRPSRHCVSWRVKPGLSLHTQWLLSYSDAQRRCPLVHLFVFGPVSLPTFNARLPKNPRSGPADTIRSSSCHAHNDQQHTPHSQQHRRHRRRSQVRAGGTIGKNVRLAITHEQAIALSNLCYDVLVLD